MVKKVVQVDIKSKGADKVDKTVKDINKGLDGLKDKAKKAFDDEGVEKFNKAANDTLKVSVDVRQKLRDIQNRMAEIGDVGDKEFQRLAKEAGAYKDQMNNANAAIKSMSADFPKMQVGVQALQAMGGAAQGVTAGMALFGSENEEVQKSIQKMMAIQSLMNSVTAVTNLLGDESAIGLKVRTIRTNVLAAAELKAAKTTKGVTAAQKGLAAAQLVGASTMKVLNWVMSLNPVFILIAAFTALAAAIAWTAADTETTAEKTEKLNDVMDKQAAALEKIIKLNSKLHDNRMRELELQDASEETKHNAQLERLKELEKERVAELNSLKIGYGAQKKMYKAALADEDYELATTIRERIDADKARIAELRSNNKEYNLSRREAEKGYSDFLENEEAKRIADEKRNYTTRLNAHKSYQAARLAAQRLAEDLHNQIEGDEITTNNIKYARLIENTKRDEKLLQQEKADIVASYEVLRSEAEKAIIDKRSAKRIEEAAKIDADAEKALQAEYLRQDEQFALLNQLRATDRENEIAGIVEGYDKKFELAMGNSELEKELELALSEEINAIKDADALKDEERAAKSWDNKLKSAKAYSSSVNDLAQGIFDIANNIGKQDDKAKEKRAKRQFEINKGLQLGMAVVDGFKAITSSLSLAPLAVGVAPNPAGIASLAMAASTTALNIGKIATAKYQGGAMSAGSGSSAPSVGSVGGGSSQPAQFNVVGDTGSNQLAETLSNAPIKTYVVASDVTTQQGLDMNQVGTASL